MSEGDRRKKATGTRKPRGKKAPPKEASPPTEPQEAPPKKKITLPAFGMAEDLLRDLKRQREEAEKAETETPSPPSTASPEDAAAALTADDPERIFEYADRLRSGSDRPETREAEVRLEAFVTFDLADEIFALPVEPIRQIMRISQITRVPHAPNPIRGVTNLRGRVIPVIDLRQRIGLPPAEIEKTHRIIVVSARKRLIGLLVDGVRQVAHLDLFKVQPPPDDVMTVQSDYIAGIYHLDRDLVLLLDVERSLVIKDSESGVA